MHYPVGWPMWRLLAGMGAALTLDVLVVEDKEAGVFIATSPNLDGLVVEAKSLAELRVEVLAAARDLLELDINRRTTPVTRMVVADNLCHA